MKNSSFTTILNTIQISFIIDLLELVIRFSLDVCPFELVIEDKAESVDPSIKRLGVTYIHSFPGILGKSDVSSILCNPQMNRVNLSIPILKPADAGRLPFANC